jgi:CopA family copper-resistance protein
MDPTDFSDVSGFVETYLLNGLPPKANWSGLFRPSERVRLRFINAGAMTYFDVRIPGLKMTVVLADGQYVQPVEVDEFRFGPGETYDVVVQPQDRAYTVYAEALDRSGFTRGTLTPRAGLSAPVPRLRPRPIRTMADMGMDMSCHGEAPNKNSGPVMAGMNRAHEMQGMQGMKMGAENPTSAGAPSLPGNPAVMHGKDTHGPGNSSVAMAECNRLRDPGAGFERSDGRVLTYADLRSLEAWADQRQPSRAIELHLTGNMDRYMWSFDGKKYSDASEPIVFEHGERLRLILVNDTMMEHPIHLHGLWMYLENGANTQQPRKHTVTVKPAERLSLLVTADAPGRWAFHCHLLLHMEMGMFRVVEVTAARGAAA